METKERREQDGKKKTSSESLAFQAMRQLHMDAFFKISKCLSLGHPIFFTKLYQRLSFLSDDFNHFKIAYVNWDIFLNSLGTENYFWGLVVSHLGVWAVKVQSPSWYSINTEWNPKKFEELKECDTFKPLIKKFWFTQNIKERLSCVQEKRFMQIMDSLRNGKYCSQATTFVLCHYQGKKLFSIIELTRVDKDPHQPPVYSYCKKPSLSLCAEKKLPMGGQKE